MLVFNDTNSFTDKIHFQTRFATWRWLTPPRSGCPTHSLGTRRSGGSTTSSRYEVFACMFFAGHLCTMSLWRRDIIWNKLILQRGAINCYKASVRNVNLSVHIVIVPFFLSVQPVRACVPQRRRVVLHPRLPHLRLLDAPRALPAGQADVQPGRGKLWVKQKWIKIP